MGHSLTQMGLEVESDSTVSHFTSSAVSYFRVAKDVIEGWAVGIDSSVS